MGRCLVTWPRSWWRHTCPTWWMYPTGGLLFINWWMYRGRRDVNRWINSSDKITIKVRVQQTIDGLQTRDGPLNPDKATNRNYIPEEDRNVTLFGGTTVLQTRTTAATKCTGMVVRTGYQTARGRLVQSILFPKQIDMKLQNDAINFVGLMGIIALIG